MLMDRSNLYKILMVLVLALFSTVVSVTAQDTGCPIDVQLALQQSQAYCVDIGPDQVCYGNWQVTAEPQPQVQQFIFAAPGDQASVAGVRSLSLSAMDPNSDAWGIAHMRLLVNSSSLEPMDVRLVLFGDVGIENLVEDRETIPITVNIRDYINVRQFPGRYGGVVDTVAPEEELVAVGRLADNSWYRVLTEDNIVGWVLASLLTPQGDPNLLTIDTDSAPYYSPMQSFLYSSTDTGSCTSAPGDGLLVQTPEGQARVSFLINEVSIDLASSQTGSTAFLQAEAGGNMAVSVLEGSATVSAGGTQYTAIAGTQIMIPLAPDLSASGPPGMPQPYDPALVSGLVSLGLDPSLDPAPPATLAMIMAANGMGGDTTQTQTTTGDTVQPISSAVPDIGGGTAPTTEPGAPTTEPGAPTEPPPPTATPCPGQSCDCHGGTCP